ncbi:hypothetical protein GJ496_007246 [Pomphorhynchus laevis]|nr:hypothetical protein GJ496_007246 [Pomphorhynchus laevis]
MGHVFITQSKRLRQNVLGISTPQALHSICRCCQQRQILLRTNYLSPFHENPAFVRKSNIDLLVDEVHLIEVNHQHALIRYLNGKEKDFTRSPRLNKKILHDLQDCIDLQVRTQHPNLKLTIARAIQPKLNPFSVLRVTLKRLKGGC